MSSFKRAGSFIKIVALFFALTLSMLAKDVYPALYSAIGDEVYRAADGYRALTEITSFKKDDALYSIYIKKADQLKEEGFGLDKESTNEQREQYLVALRKLSKEKGKINRSVLKSIRQLKADKMDADLALLSRNPYPLIRQASIVKKATVSPKELTRKEKVPHTERPGNMQDSLADLKEQLLMARSENSSREKCLNDITAINYWIVKADELSENEEWCRANDACKQVVSYERASKTTCGEDDPLYIQWQDYSAIYRTTLKKEFSDACY